MPPSIQVRAWNDEACRHAVPVHSVGGAIAGDAAAQVAAAQSLAEIGKGIAETHCARCHVVDPSRPFSGISSTPMTLSSPVELG